MDKETPHAVRMYGISGSSRYILKGLQPIHGKKLTTFDEINDFYHNYEKILEETRINTTKQQEEILQCLNKDEERLELLLKEWNTQQKNGHNNFFSYICSTVQGYFRKHKINKDLRDVRTRKEHLIAYKQRYIENECNKVTDSFHFIEQNKSFLIGAYAEEQVIQILSQLPNEYVIINDVNLRFKPPIYWREENDHILTSQIDHIAIGPTGMFLIETKNWKSFDIEKKSDDLIFQVHRSNYALWRYLLKYYPRRSVPRIRNVIVSKSGINPHQKLDRFIDIITPDQLFHYITQREAILSNDAINTLVKVVEYTR